MFFVCEIQDLFTQVWISVRGYVGSLLLGGTDVVSNLEAVDLYIPYACLT